MWISPMLRRLSGPGGLLLLTSLGVSGCANPGPPRPPSLNLPTPVKDLHADRVGSEVRLAWTTPADSTDDVPLKAPLSAEICRQLDSPGSPAAPCIVVQHLPVKPGPSSAIDPLPPDLLADPVRLLRYRVRLLNASGRSAAASLPAFAAAGQAPSPITGLHAAPSPTGTRLLWLPVSTPAATVFLDRTTTAAAPPAQPPATSKPHAAPGRHHDTLTTLRLQASPATPDPANPGPATPDPATPHAATPDPGGTVDPSARRNTTYSYTAWRSRSFQIAGQTLTLRSPDSAPLQLTIHDTSPPATPTGLEAVFDRPTPESRGSVDLSWEAGTEPDLVGYWVERATLPSSPQPSSPPALSKLEWHRLNPDPVVGPAFRDLPPSPGTYSYRILAADTTGNVSPPTPPATIRVTQP